MEALAELGLSQTPVWSPWWGAQKRGLTGDEEDLVVGEGRSCCLKCYNTLAEVRTHEAWSHPRSDRSPCPHYLLPGAHCMPSAGPRVNS